MTPNDKSRKILKSVKFACSSDDYDLNLYPGKIYTAKVLPDNDFINVITHNTSDVWQPVKANCPYPVYIRDVETETTRHCFYVMILDIEVEREKMIDRLKKNDASAFHIIMSINS